MDLENIPFDLCELVNSCEADCAPKAAERGGSLYFFCEPLDEKRLIGEPEKLRKALLCLLDNAMLAGQGVVRLIATAEQSREDRIAVCFEIKSGGTPAKADEEMERGYGGITSGLMEAKTEIELMGGRLKAVNEPREAAGFVFTLSFAVRDEPAGASTVGLEAVYKKPLFKGDVLVCEDNIISQQVILGHLSRVGLYAVIAENGELGVETAAARMEEGNPFDLILMDVLMPVMDGLEAAGRLKKIGNRAPIIAMTADITPEDRIAYGRMGISDCLPKPFKARKLWACLLKHLTPVGSETAPGGFANGEPLPAAEHTVINRTLGFQRVSESREVYERLLNDFADRHKADFKSFSGAFWAGDTELARRTVRAVRNAAAMIGATRFANAAHDIEKSLSSGEPSCTREQMSSLEAELDAVLSELVGLKPDTYL